MWNRHKALAALIVGASSVWWAIGPASAISRPPRPGSRVPRENAVSLPANGADCTPAPEVCDAMDNDCDGVTDEQDANAPPLCATGYSCVNVDGVIGCAVPCMFAGFPCPPGYACGSGNSTETGLPLGNFCVEYLCEDCAKQTLFNPDGSILCAPKGTPPDANCAVPPVCICKSFTACRNPCAGVVCDEGKVCPEVGTYAGYCVTNACPDVPCAGCNAVCYNGTCVTNPCTPDVCPGQVCKPSEDYTTFTCVDACADGGCGGGGGVSGSGGEAGGPEAGSGGSMTGAGGATTNPGGCACAVVVAQSPRGWLLMVGALVVRVLRRQSRATRSKRGNHSRSVLCR